jgi:flagellar biosynthetic protein FliQ
VSIDLVLDLMSDTLFQALLLAGPLLGVSLLTGLVIAILQAVTQIQEQTLTFVPKLVAVGITFMVLFGWMLSTTVQFTRELFMGIPGLAP